MLLALLLASIVFTTKDADPKTGDTILEPMFTPRMRLEQIAGPVAAKGEVLQCELVNHAADPDKREPVGWSEVKCNNGSRYRMKNIILHASN